MTEQEIRDLADALYNFKDCYTQEHIDSYIYEKRGFIDGYKECQSDKQKEMDDFMIWYDKCLMFNGYANPYLIDSNKFTSMKQVHQYFLENIKNKEKPI